MPEEPVRRQEEPPPPTPPPSALTDPWQIRFSKLMQVSGLGVIVYETVAEDNDRVWLLFVALAMMTGGLGAQILLRWMLQRLP